MTDYEKLTNLFKEFGIPFTERRDGNIMVTLRPMDDIDAIVVGYRSCVSDFEFTTKGDFINVGLWED